MDLFEFHGFNPKSKLKELEKKNLYRFPTNYLLDSNGKDSLNSLFFSKSYDIADFLNRCVLISKAFILFLDESNAKLAYLDRYYFQRFMEIFNQMASMHKKHEAIKSLPTLLLLMREVIKGERIDFFGEPLEGDSVHGLTRNKIARF